MEKLPTPSYQLPIRKIGIDASRAFLKKRTGIEEYSYQVIKHLRDALPSDANVTLYVRKKLEIGNWKLEIRTQDIDFQLPSNWTVRALWAPRLWTQVRLSLEMLLHPVDVLFIPAHTVPVIHPRRTVVTIHGLEYEFSPESYSWYERFYMRFSIRNSVRWATSVIAVSENTQRDLVRRYQVPAEKITVIYEGVERIMDDGRWKLETESQENHLIPIFQHLSSPYFLFIGRVEERNNVARIVEAFESFKQKTGLPHKLLLAGKPGYGYEEIKNKIEKSKYRDQIQELGYITEDKKWELLRGAETLLFPSLYEGFGLPILEAQQVGTPVITSTTASLPEIAGEGALLVDPVKTEALTEAMAKLATDPVLRADIIDKATQNVDRFSWATCVRKIEILLFLSKERLLSTAPPEHPVKDSSGEEAD